MTPEPTPAPAPDARSLLLLPDAEAATTERSAEPTPRHPLLPLALVAILVLAAGVHEALIRQALDVERLAWLAGPLAAWGLVSLVVLSRWRGRPSPLTGLILLLVLDMAAVGATVYLTGASRSLLFWLFLLRAGEEAVAGWRRAAVAALLSVAGYVAVLALGVYLADQPILEESESAKVALLVLGGMFVVAVGWWRDRDAARHRAELEEARRFATDLAEDAEQGSEPGAADPAVAGAPAVAAASARRSLPGVVGSPGSQRLSLLRVMEEVRRPLRDALREAQLAERGGNRDHRRRHLEEALREGRHLLDIVNELLDLARVEAGQVARDLSPVQVRPALDEVLEQGAQAADIRGIQLPTSCPLDDDLWVVANPRKLRQVFANLVSNAIKYNRPGGSVDVDCRLEERWLRVAVRDTGPGIPPDRVQAAFAPFDRLGAEQTAVRGTGLGLTLARSLVEAMGGELGLESEPDVGSTFWFRLRLSEPPSPISSDA